MTGLRAFQTSDSRPETPVFHLGCRIHRFIHRQIYRQIYRQIHCWCSIKQAKLEPGFELGFLPENPDL
jgi:uncharacterized protein YjaG (DUF416 family)